MPIPISAGVRQLLAAPNLRAPLDAVGRRLAAYRCRQISANPTDRFRPVMRAPARRNRNLTSIAVAALGMFAETLNRTLAGRHRQPVPS
jgi:hypothetical protein